MRVQYDQGKMWKMASSDVNFGPNKRADGQADTKVHNFNILGITYMKIKIERLTVSSE